MTFLPYGFNESYIHLPENASFCVKYGKSQKQYKTDNFGGRILNNQSIENAEVIQVFGDSQVLGLDIEKMEDHYLFDLYDTKTFAIYAAPNNGPYQVINFLNDNKNIIQKKIIVSFNFSVDIYRINNEWLPQNFVALKDYELDEILEFPLKYRFILLKNLLLNKNFTLSRFNNKEMKNLFLNSDHQIISDNLSKYFKELNETAKKLNIKVDFVVTQPYWMYSINKKKKQLKLEKNLKLKVQELICDSFKFNNNIGKILISEPQNYLQLKDLTLDKRHLKSNIINLKTYENICKI